MPRWEMILYGESQGCTLYLYPRLDGMHVKHHFRYPPVAFVILISFWDR